MSVPCAGTGIGVRTLERAQVSDQLGQVVGRIECLRWGRDRGPNRFPHQRTTAVFNTHEVKKFMHHDIAPTVWPACVEERVAGLKAHVWAAYVRQTPKRRSSLTRHGNLASAGGFDEEIFQNQTGRRIDMGYARRSVGAIEIEPLYRGGECFFLSRG